MKMAPRMIQSMEILQLPTLALEERIAEELAGNIALEIDEPVADRLELAEAQAEERRLDREGERALKPGEQHAEEGFERLGRMEREYRDAFDNQFSGDYQTPRPQRHDDGEIDPKMEAMSNTAARAESLTDQLLHQWALTEVDERLRATGEHLIAYIDEDGYLRTDLDTIADQAPQGVAREALDEVLPIVQASLEPPGIGGRDLRECLLLQIDAKQREAPEVDRSVERKLVADHLPDIEANRLPRIAQDTGWTIERIKAGLERLRGLDPRPGRRLSPQSPSVVIPDAIVEYDDERDEYVAALFDGRLPRLRVNPEYAAMVKDRSVDKETRRFVDGNVRNARWLIEAIDLRHSTMLRVLRAVLVHQRDFFDYGPQALKPLPMTQVAEQLGVHVATISRAVAGKWIQTPRGVLPLRKFFTSGTETAAGEDVSWDAVKETLREIIEAEDKTNPLGDDKLAALLKERGIDIARRTVAKYRDQLGIPTAKLRKTF